MCIWLIYNRMRKGLEIKMDLEIDQIHFYFLEI